LHSQECLCHIASGFVAALQQPSNIQTLLLLTIRCSRHKAESMWHRHSCLCSVELRSAQTRVSVPHSFWLREHSSNPVTQQPSNSATPPHASATLGIALAVKDSSAWRITSASMAAPRKPQLSSRTK